MNWNIRRRLLVLAIVPGALLSLFLLLHFTYGGTQLLEEQLRLRGIDMARFLAPVSEFGVLSGDNVSLQTLVQQASEQPAVKAALIVGRDGRVLAVSGRVSLSADALRHPLSVPGQVARGSDWIAFGAPIIRSVVDFEDIFNRQDQRASTSPSDAIGTVFVEIDASSIYGRQHELLFYSLLIVAAGLALAIAHALSLVWRARKPVAALSNGFRQLAEGRFDVRVPTISVGEIGQLETKFNDMASRLETAHRAMKLRIEEATAHLAFQARHDALTHLINRREFEARLVQSLAAVEAGGVEVAVLFMDIDRFKAINDGSGYLAGDELLRQISRLFQGRLRERDMLARIGGDEFGLILPDCNLESAQRVAQDLCQLTANYRFVWQDKLFRLGVSIGLLSLDPGMRSVTDILTAGDAACAAAKEAGRNQVHIHVSGETSHAASGSERWRERIDQALRSSQLRYGATPVRPLIADRTTPAIADISIFIDDFQHNTALFMDMAERTSLAPMVEEQALDQALTLLQRTRAQNPDSALCLMLPLTVSTIRNRDAAGHLAEILESHNYAGQGLCFSIAEDIIIRHIAETGVLCAALRQKGCQIAITDFGGWLASFNHLDVILPDFIRINRSLTLDLRRHRSAAALIRAIHEIAADRNILTIGEGIDDPETLKSLQEIGIDFAQGPAVAPMEMLENWIQLAPLKMDATASGSS